MRASCRFSSPSSMVAATTAHATDLRCSHWPAIAAAAVVAFAPPKFRAAAAAFVILAGLTPWLMDPRVEIVLTWKESQVNSDARRAWTSQAANCLRSNYRSGSGIFTTFGDISGIYRLGPAFLCVTLSLGTTGQSGPRPLHDLIYSCVTNGPWLRAAILYSRLLSGLIYGVPGTRYRKQSQ